MNKEITSEECKRLLLEVLINIDRFCKQNGINYSLGGGTLIGAIRHKGFIPWDDDIDIMMQRDDYERFISLYKDERYAIVDGACNTNHAHVRVADTKTVLRLNAWRAQFYKAGLWIDVFPIDKVPDTQRGYLCFKKWLWFLFEMQLTGEVNRKGFINKIMHISCKPFSAFFGKQALRAMKRYNKKNTQSVACLAASWYSNSPKFPASYMEDFVEVEFEGYRVKAIKQYDTYLRGIYGDYMQFPPKEKQKSHHSYTVYWKK
jgi:lipopolysaccharide cholinephosphotransferase